MEWLKNTYEPSDGYNIANFQIAEAYKSQHPESSLDHPTLFGKLVRSTFVGIESKVQDYK